MHSTNTVANIENLAMHCRVFGAKLFLIVAISILFTDIDECKDHSVCPVELTCKNNDGSFECTCDDGFVRAGDHCIREFQ